MKSEPLGLYLHIPFCLSKCRYCDFYSLSGRLCDREGYVRALIAEMTAARAEWGPRVVDTVFFGGGTPTLLGTDSLIRLLRAARELFTFAPGTEISFEMNPATATRQDLSRLREAGFGRVSIGVQSLDESELRALGRIHGPAEAMQALRAARLAGFEDINADLMYAIPGQTPRTLAQTLDTLLAFRPSHISAYGLIPEPGTPLFEKLETLDLPGDEGEAEMYRLVSDRLEAAGYEHYEVSNYALPGRQCRHNLRYWRLSPYLGFGPAAHSFVDGVRLENARDLDAYLRAPTSQRRVEEKPTPAELAEEYLMLGLRTSEGISLSRFCEMSGTDLAQIHADFLARCERAGYLRRENDRLFLTPEGFYVGMAVTAELLADIPATST